MRVIGQRELNSVAGGCTPPEATYFGEFGVDVTGSVTCNNRLMYGSCLGNMDSTDSTGGGGGDSGGGSGEINLPGPFTPCQERAVDSLGLDLMDVINTLEAETGNEYASVIVKNADGTFKAVSILGDPFFGGYSPDGFSFTATLSDLGINSWSQVVGIIHNHPPFSQADITRLGLSGTVDSNNELARQPSPADFALANTLANKGADWYNFRQYVRGPDGVLRQYGLTDFSVESSDIVTRSSC